MILMLMALSACFGAGLMRAGTLIVRAWKRTGEPVPQERLETFATGLDWSEELPSPQQLAFEQKLAWERLQHIDRKWRR